MLSSIVMLRVSLGARVGGAKTLIMSRRPPAAGAASRFCRRRAASGIAPPTLADFQNRRSDAARAAAGIRRFPAQTAQIRVV